MPIAYAAHTETCTFLLDEGGICRQIIRRAASMRGAPKSDGVSRCIGAQYVASIDVTAEGLLAAMPKLGAPMLFAYTSEDGHIALVRTGNVTKFEAKGRPAAPATRTAQPERVRHSGVVPRPPPPPALPGPDESIEVELDLEDMEDPTALFARKPAAMWLYDTSPPPAPRTPRPSPALYSPPPPIPVRRLQGSEPEIPPPPRVPLATDTAPTLELRAAAPARRGMLPVRRRA